MRTLFHMCRALALLMAVIGPGCGMRTSIQAEADTVDDPLDVDADRPCGRGLPCDPDNLGGRTCESVGLGSGVLSCDPDTCNLDISACGNPLVDGGTQSPIGTGSPGTPGLFGTTAGTGGGGLFGAGQGGLFGTGGDAGFFGAGNADGGFFGMGNTPGGGNDPDEDGGTEEPGTGGTGAGGTGAGGTGAGGQGGLFGSGFFGGGFFGGGQGGGIFGSGFFGGQ